MENKIKNNCQHCGLEYEHNKSHKSKYCSTNCRVKANIQKKITGTEGKDFVICGICNLKFKEINSDHLKTHNITKEEYDTLYNSRISDETRLNKNTLTNIMTPELSKKLSESHTEKNYKIKYGELLGSIKYEQMKSNKSYKNSVSYYIDNYGLILGKKLFKERQLKGAMTLNNQIKLHGITIGTNKYNEWLNKQKNKNNLSYYIDLYGYELGLNKWFDKNNKISIANSKINKTLKNEYKKYCRLVDKMTRISLQIYDLENINLRGFEYGYDLDHKVSKIYGFKNNIEPHVIGHISNLEVINSSENRRKQHNSNIDVNQVLNETNKDLKYLKIVKQSKL